MSTYGRPIAGLLPQGSGNTYGRPIGAAFQRIIPAPPSAGLQVWLKADAGVTTSGSNVTAWADQSGVGNNFTTGAGTPVLLSAGSGINGLPAVRFNNGGGNDHTCYLTAIFNPSAWAGITVLYVVRMASSGSIPSYNTTIGWHSGGVWWSFNSGSALAGDGQGVGWAGALGSVLLGAYSPTPVNSQVIYEAYQYQKTTWTMSGAFAGTKSDTSFPTSAVTAIVGSNSGVPGDQSTSDIAEILVYDHALSAADLATAHGYLQGRYGVS